MGAKLDTVEKEKERLENINERLTSDLAETKSNMTHYRSSCQKLQKELESAGQTIQELDNRYEMLLRSQNTKMISRMNSGSSLGSIENQLEHTPTGNAEKTPTFETHNNDETNDVE